MKIDKIKELFGKNRIILPRELLKSHSSAHAYVYGVWINEFGFDEMIVENQLLKHLFLGEVIGFRSAKRKIKQMAEDDIFNYSLATPKERKEIVVRNKNVKGEGAGFKTCSWCGCHTTTLHSHHYPIQKKDGGEETVDICGNCHHEYHSIKFKIKANDVFNVKGLLGEIKSDTHG